MYRGSLDRGKGVVNFEKLGLRLGQMLLERQGDLNFVAVQCF